MTISVEKPSRRTAFAALGALAGVPALAILPAAALAETPMPGGAAADPDAALVRLFDDLRGAYERSDALLTRLEDLEEEKPVPPPPAALLRMEDDSRFASKRRTGGPIRARRSPADIKARERRHIDDVGILGAE